MWPAIIMFVVSLVVSYALSRPQNAKPAAFDDMQIPQSAEGTAQAMDFGTCWATDWMVLGTANFETRAIRKRASKLSKKQTVGHRYFMDLLMGFGRGECDAFRRIKIGGREAWAGNVTANGVIRIDKEDLFGGTDGMGGVVGDLHIMMGAPDQPRHPLAVAAFGPLTSAFRGVCTALFTGQLCAMTPNPEPWEVQRTTILKGWDGPVWYPERATITPAGMAVPTMNAAHILVKVLTHRDVGRGLPRARMDLAAYAALADLLHAEGFGLCLRWNRQVRVTEFLQQVCDHIGASQYVDRRTGLLTVSAARGGYDVDTLPVFDADSGLLEIEEDDNPTGWGAINEVIVQYRDPHTNETRKARWQNLAAIQAYGRVSETLDFPGLPTHELASRVAQREGELRSSGAKTFKLVFDRRGGQIQPAGVFRIRAPEHGIAEIVLRAGDIRDGTLEDGRIRIAAVQDVFAFDATSYVADPPSTHTDPDRTPLAATTRRVEEATYRDLVLELGVADAAARAPTTGSLRALAARPSGLSLDYDLRTRAGTAAFESAGTGDWCPTAVALADIPAAPTPITIPYTGGSQMHLVEAGEAAVIGTEVMRIDAHDAAAGTLTLARGCVDTVPAAHVTGARLWFPDSGGSVDASAYGTGVQVSAKMLTRTTAGELAEAMAPTDTIAMAGRQGRPYPPGRLRINGQVAPAVVSGELVVSIAHRDRRTQGAALVDTEAGSIGPEPSTTWTLRIYRQPSTLLHTAAGLTGTEYTWPAPQNGALRIEVEAVRDGLVSAQKHVHAVTLEGVP